jgi:hypothetical protein
MSGSWSDYELIIQIENAPIQFELMVLCSKKHPFVSLRKKAVGTGSLRTSKSSESFRKEVLRMDLL